MKRKTKPVPTRRQQAKPFEMPAEFLKPPPRPDARDDAGLIEAERRLDALTSWWNLVRAPEEQWNRLGDLVHDLEEFIARAPAHTPSGVMAKLRRLRYFAGVDDAMEGDVYSRDLLATALASLRGFHLETLAEEGRYERRRMDAGLFRCAREKEPHLDALAVKWFEHETATPPANLSPEDQTAYIDRNADAADQIAMQIAQPAGTLSGVRLKLPHCHDDRSTGRAIVRGDAHHERARRPWAPHREGAVTRVAG